MTTTSTLHPEWEKAVYLFSDGFKCVAVFASVCDAVLWFVSLEGTPGVLQFRQSSLISVHFYTSSESVRGDLRMLDPPDAGRQWVMILI